MALDARVSCDCFERNLLRSPPPPGYAPAVDPFDGSLDCGSADPDARMAFDAWMESGACEHELGRVVDHFLGNVARVANLRARLGRHPELFPVLLTRVIYDGTHCGDCIAAGEVPLLVPEVRALAGLRGDDSADEDRLRHFEAQMRELVTAALAVGKPICF